MKKLILFILFFTLVGAYTWVSVPEEKIPGVKEPKPLVWRSPKNVYPPYLNEEETQLCKTVKMDKFLKS